MKFEKAKQLKTEDYNMNIFKPTQTAHLLVALGLSLALIAAPASAAKKGPRASLSAATVCELDGADLNVTIRLTDKTSGSGEALLTSYDINGLAKTVPGKWVDDRDTFATKSSVFTPATDVRSHTESFNLCGLDLDSVKGLNASASISYRLNGGAINDETRTITNMCSDDPATIDLVEPAGIKLTSELIANIEAKCS